MSNEIIQYIVDKCGVSKECGYTSLGWYFWDETWANCHGPFDSKDETISMLEKYNREVLGIQNCGTNYIADHESRPKQFKFENGRRVWVTNEGYLDTDFGPLEPHSESPTISDKLRNALDSAPIHRLGESESDFIGRFKVWYRGTRKVLGGNV